MKNSSNNINKEQVKSKETLINLLEEGNKSGKSKGYVSLEDVRKHLEEKRNA